MKNIQFQVDGFLEGGRPNDKEYIETIIELEYYSQLIDLIENGKLEEAINLVNENLGFEFEVDDIPPLEDAGFEFLDVYNINAFCPYIEEIDGVKIPLFGHISANFFLTGPKEIIINWMDKKGDMYKFNEDLFEEWLDDGYSLSDGCNYNLDGAIYDLIGWGANACSINEFSIEEACNLDN